MPGSVRPVLTGGFAVTVAQVSVSSKDVEMGRQRRWRPISAGYGRPVPSEDDGGCSLAASDATSAGPRQVKKTSTFRHSSRSLPLKLSI